MVVTKKKPAAKKSTPVKKKKAANDTPVEEVSYLTPQWSTACTDWQKLIVEAKSLIKFAPLFPTAANDGMAVFDDLQIVDAGVTFGDCRPWVRDFAASIFGAYCDIDGHPQAGRRLIRTFFMLISKKNTKSTIGAGIMLTAIIRNWRKEAEYIIISPTKEVADNSFNPIKAAIEADPNLSELFLVQKHIRTVTHRVTNATLKVVAADSQTVSGKKATGILVDEMHEFGKMSKAEDMLLEATGGLMSRPEGFVIYLTTQSSEPPAGVFKKELAYARKVRDGIIEDNSYLPIIYEFPDKIIANKGYLKEENWYITNPNLGLTVDFEHLRQKFKKAGASGEDSLQGVLAKHFNVQIGLDLGSDRWPGADYWLENQSEAVDSIEKVLEMSEVVTVGMDGGGLDDLLGFAIVGRVAGTLDQFVSYSKAWVLESALKLRVEIADRLRDFHNAGELSIITAPGQDIFELTMILKLVYTSGICAGMGVDPSRIAAIKTALESAGVPTEEPYMVKVSQGWHLYGAILYTERMLSSGNLKHAVQTLMDWCVGNCKVVPRSNAMLVTKEASGKAKIDPVMALFNAMELMSYNPESKRGAFDFSRMRLLG